MRKRSIVIFFISLIFFAGVFYFGNTVLDALSTANVEIDDEELGKGNIIEQKVDNELLFLMLGVDQNEDGSEANTRTDTIMLTKVNFDLGTIDILSIPRDTQVYIDGRIEKINAAHAYYGTTGALNAVKDLLDLDIDYYMKIDYDAFIKFIDAIGGIEVDSPRELNYPDSGIYIPKGISRVNGKNALYFARMREAMGWSDLQRINNQQSLLGTIMLEALKPSNITKVGTILDIYKTDVETNVPAGTLISYVPKVRNFSKDKLNTYVLPGTDGYEEVRGRNLSFYYKNESETQALVDQLFFDYRDDVQQIN